MQIIGCDLHAPVQEVMESSQTLQELDDGVLLGALQLFKLLDDVASLTTMSGDSVEKC
jgi:hypothetical protein